MTTTQSPSSTPPSTLEVRHLPGRGPVRNRDRLRMLEATEELIQEYADRLPAGVVIACVTRCKAELAASGVRNGLSVATAAAARSRLMSLAAIRAC